jgi:hypothetical protein
MEYGIQAEYMVDTIGRPNHLTIAHFVLYTARCFQNFLSMGPKGNN